MYKKIIMLIITLSLLSGCISNREVIYWYHRAGVKPTGNNENKNK